jgi:Flp pilus assembly protein TadG
MTVSKLHHLLRLRAGRFVSKPSGQAMFELALLVPLLCLVMFAIIEYSRALNYEQIMVDLTRQGSNMASRGTPLATAASSVAQGSAPLSVAKAGEVIITSVARVNNVDSITGQATSGALSQSSKIGTGVGNIAKVPATVDAIFTLNPTQTVYITEVYYPLSQITPIAKMWGLVMPSMLYQVGYF